MSGAATTSVLFTSHELELLIEAVTNLAIEMDPINSEEAMIRDELAAMEYDLREALERVGVQPTPVTAEWYRMKMIPLHGLRLRSTSLISAFKHERR